MNWKDIIKFKNEKFICSQRARWQQWHLLVHFGGKKPTTLSQSSKRGNSFFSCRVNCPCSCMLLAAGQCQQCSLIQHGCQDWNSFQQWGKHAMVVMHGQTLMLSAKVRYKKTCSKYKVWYCCKHPSQSGVIHYFSGTRSILQCGRQTPHLILLAKFW